MLYIKGIQRYIMNTTLPHLTPDRVKIIDKIESKKCAFDVITDILETGQDEIKKTEIFDALIAREKLGNTCIGNGIAIPRAHVPIANPRAALLIIKKGLNIETVDQITIKVFFTLIIPNDQREKYSIIIKKLNLILIEEKNLNILNETPEAEYLANYFESILIRIMEEKQCI